MIICIPSHPQLENRILILRFSNLIVPLADVAKLVDALDLGSSAARHGGSSPSIRTNIEPSITQLLLKTGKDWGFLVQPHIKFYRFGNHIRQAFFKSGLY